jgi:hypothetical protein
MLGIGKSFGLYGYETWSLIFREECKLRAFESRAIRRIFGTKGEKAISFWRKLHYDELNNLSSFFLEQSNHEK